MTPQKIEAGTVAAIPDLGNSNQCEHGSNLPSEARSKQVADLLEISPCRADGGELIGRAPAEVPSEILSRYYRAQNPLKAVRARCLDCCCGNASEVRKCVAVDCPSWPFRMGVNPFRQKRTLSQEQKRAMAERLRATV